LIYGTGGTRERNKREGPEIETREREGPERETRERDQRDRFNLHDFKFTEFLTAKEIYRRKEGREKCYYIWHKAQRGNSITIYGTRPKGGNLITIYRKF
jgi:hypothetical protein